MPNTKVTIEYSNGDTREFIASDELEKLIDDGEMFSVSTVHSDMSLQVETEMSKMYAGNPIAALGNMMMMRRNAEQLDVEDEPSRDVIVQMLTACISLLSDECTSYQSVMHSANGKVLNPEPLKVVE